MKLSTTQKSALKVVDEGGHISFDRFTKKFRLVPKNSAGAMFISRTALHQLLNDGLLRAADRTYETGTHALTDAGRTALRERGR